MLSATEAASSVDPLVLALAGGVGGLIASLVSVSAQLWISKRGRDADNARRAEDRRDVERDAALTRREDRYDAALSAVWIFREHVEMCVSIIESVAPRLDPTTKPGEHETPTLVLGDDPRQMQLLEPVKEAGARYAELREATITAVGSARTVGSKPVRDVGHKLAVAAFRWQGVMPVLLEFDAETNQIASFSSRSDGARSVANQLTSLAAVSLDVERVLRMELGFEDAPGDESAKA